MYYKLKDPGTSYYDASQQLGIVGKRIADFKNTPHVHAAVADGRLVKVEDKEEIEQALAEQEAYDKLINERSLEVTLTKTDGERTAILEKQAQTPINIKSKKDDKDSDEDDARKKLEVVYKTATGEEAKPEQSDDDLQKAIDALAAEKSKDTPDATKAKKGLAALADEGNA